MALRLLKASSFYSRYLRWFYASNPGIELESYDNQHHTMMRDAFALAGSWKRALERDGQFEVEELVVNAEPMQKRWAIENGVPYREDFWLVDIFHAQLERLNPRILYAHSIDLAYSVKDEIKKKLGNKLFIICYDGIARHDPRICNNADLMLTCVRRSVDFYRTQGVKVLHMPFGFDPHVLADVARSQGNAKACFVGTADLRAGHLARGRLLQALCRDPGLNLWLTGVPSGPEVLRALGSFVRRGEARSLMKFPILVGCAKTLRGYNRGELFGVKMLSTLASSPVCLNIHHEAAGAEAVNIRLYEATGVGTCLLTDWKPTITEVFEANSEVVTFKTLAEAREKLRYLLDNPASRLEIAARGQQKTLKKYLYGDRVREVGEELLRSI